MESLFKPHLIILYTISGTRSKKKTRAKVQVKDINLKSLVLIKTIQESSNSMYFFIFLPENMYQNFSEFT